MQPDLVRKEQMPIRGWKRHIHQRHSTGNGQTAESYEVWRIRRSDLPRTAEAEQTDHGDAPHGTEDFVMEAGTYAVFRQQGDMDDIGARLDQIDREWLAKTMYASASYVLEVVDDEHDPEGRPGEAFTELWLPVAYTKPPHCGRYHNTWTTAAQALREAIKFTDKKDISLVEVMGYTGHAFRINIHEDNVDVAGPTAWDWGPVLAEGLRNLGIRASFLGEPNYTPPTPELLERAIEMVQRSVDQGIPAIAWDLFVPEFGVIFGYDDEKLEFHAKDVTKEGTLPYQKLGRGQVGELFVLTLNEFAEMDKKAALTGALELITHHARVRYHRHPKPPYQNGLAGYDAWIGAFRRGAVDMFGNAYNAALVCDARAHAAAFLRHVQLRWNGDSPEERGIARLAGEAAEHYQAVFDALVLLPPLYPFPQGGNPNIAANAAYSIDVLERAKAAEERGVEVLERLLVVLRGA